MTDCLIVGAGLSGLSAATVLRQRGLTVTLVDKGSRPGGRLATRPLHGGLFDYGAQFFTVRDPRFAEAVSRWQNAGLVAPWFSDGGHTRYYAPGGMNSIAALLAGGLDLHIRATVKSIHATSGAWRVELESGETHQARALILTAPVPQSLALLDAGNASLPTTVRAVLEAIDYDPCFALLAALEGPSAIPAPGYLRPADGPIAWLADNTAKGLSAGPAAVTIHATPAFTRHHFDAPREEVTRLLLEAAAPLLPTAPAATHLHRWKFSQPLAPYPEPCLSTSCPSTSCPAPLVFAGDAFGAPRVEGAWLSGWAAAHNISTNHDMLI